MAALRRLLDTPREHDRNFLASYARNYLLIYLKRAFNNRWPFGDSSIMESVVDIKTSELLRPTNGSDGEIVLSGLRREMTKIMLRWKAESVPAESSYAASNGEVDFDNVADQQLLSAFQTILRGIGKQGISQEWGPENPEKKKVRKGFLDVVRRHPQLTTEWIGREQFLLSDRSDTRLPPMAYEKLGALLHVFEKSYGDVLEALLPYLEPSSTDGGYVYVMELVALYCELRDGDSRPSDHVAADDRFIPFLRERERRALESEAKRLIIDNDLAVALEKARKGGEPDGDGAIRRLFGRSGTTWARVTSEVVLRRCKLGCPELERFTQKDLTIRWLSGLSDKTYDRDHKQRIDYLVKRLVPWEEERLKRELG